jgi:hypothetical protein
VVYRVGLENRSTERYRGFESLSLREEGRIFFKKTNAMEIFYFSLGVVTVVITLTVVGMFQLKMFVNKLNLIVDQSKEHLRELESIVQSEIPTNLGKIEDRISLEISELYGVIDSRIDKLDSRIHKELDLIIRETESKN